MSNRESFLRAIQDEPDDPTHRLVFADWLEESGDAARSEFVRLGAEAMRRDEWGWELPLLRARYGRLLREHETPWREEDNAASWSGVAYHYRRGLAEVMEVAPAEMGGLRFDPPRSALWVRGPVPANDLFDTPDLLRVRELRLERAPDDSFDAIASSDHLHALTSLTVRLPCGGWDQLVGTTIVSLAAHPDNIVLPPARPPALRRLRLRGGTVSRQVLGAMRLPGWRGLLELDLSHSVLPTREARAFFADGPLDTLEILTIPNTVGLADLVPLLTNGRLPNLRSLGLAQSAGAPTRAFNDALAALDLPSLRHLDLSQTAITPESLAALARSPVAPRLESLRLTLASRLTTPAAHSLAAGQFHSLRHLDLGGTTIGLGGLTGLLDAPWMPGLASLGLSGLRLRSHAGQALGAADSLGGLRLLDVSGNPLNAEGVAALVSSPHLAGLRSLDLRSTHPASEGIAALCRAPMLERLEVLSLGGEEWIGGADPVPLAATGRCRNLQRLRWDRAAPATMLRVQSAFGPAVAYFGGPYNDGL